jgi:hypothetical protein
MNFGANSCVDLPEETQAGSLPIREFGRPVKWFQLDPGVWPTLFYMPLQPTTRRISMSVIV